LDPNELMQQTRDALTVKRVFGEPFERDDVTVIPVASLRGGGGGGTGEGGSGEGKGSGSGGGFGITARPAGVYIIQSDKVRWQPAVDVNQVILGGQIVAVVALLVFRSVRRRGA
jgi:uncharacterized spore protein YtfJ